MAQTVSNIKVEPVYATFGEDVMQVEKITCVADSSSSLNNKYFLFYTTGGTKNYAWFNVGGAGTDPAVSGGTANAVAISANATAAAVATALAGVLTAVTGFDATASGAEVTLTATSAGYAKPAHEGAAATGFTFETVVYGDTAEDLGALDGDVEVSFEAKTVEITSHQSGSDILSHINTGNNVGLAVTLKETTSNQLRKMFLGHGDSLIPDGTGVSSTEVWGWGSSQQFRQTLQRARKLVLHPQVLPASNKSRDLTFWKAFPQVESLKFSGENILMLPVKFMIYPDFTKDSRVNKVAYGDATQTLT